MRRSRVRLHGGGLGGLQGRFARRLRAGPASQGLLGWLRRGGAPRLPRGLRRTDDATQTSHHITSLPYDGDGHGDGPHLAGGRPGGLAGGMHQRGLLRLLRGPLRGTAQVGLPRGPRRRGWVRVATRAGKGFPAGLRAGHVSRLHRGQAAHGKHTHTHTCCKMS